MPRNVYILLLAQFLTAFADYAILFTAVAIAMHSPNSPGWYMAALQGLFLVSAVILAPWVGPFADERAKAVVLIIANAMKALGAGLMFLGIDPLFSYAVVGVGATLYAPAKYGILPELVPHDTLVTANGLLEGVTIVAILGGSVIGGMVADYSIHLALASIGILFLLAALAASFIERLPSVIRKRPAALANFLYLGRKLLHTSRARFCVLGVTLFWAAAAALRVMLVAWAPLVLNIHDSAGIAKLTFAIAVGIAVGAVVVPQIIPLERLRRARFAAYAMSVAILLLENVPFLEIISGVWQARVVLFLVGFAGGIFVVPINAALQEIGHQSIGSGNTIAIQQFFESMAMALATMLYGFAAAQGAGPVISIVVLGLLVMVATILVSWRLPKREIFY